MSKWINFKLVDKKDRKTQFWAIQTKDDSNTLGWIAWYSSWRKYAFFPLEKSIYEEECLRDIANFCETETSKYKTKNK